LLRYGGEVDLAVLCFWHRDENPIASFCRLRDPQLT
jgi:hypothetical protein